MSATPVLLPSNGHYYDLILDEGNQSSWQEALDLASGMTYNGMPGHLATLATEAEHLFIGEQWPIRDLYYYIGGYQYPTTATAAANWKWITGEAFSFTGWTPDEPNDWKVDENRLAVSPSNRDFGWSDVQSVWGSYYGGFFVEYERSTSVPEGGAGFVGLIVIAGLLASGRRRSA